MGDAKRDENDRLRAGTLPEDPGADAVAIPIDTTARKHAAKLAKEQVAQAMPNDVDAERSLLAALLWCGTFAAATQNPSTVADLLEQNDAFYVPAHRAIWSAMLGLRQRMAPCDVTAVHSELLRERKVGVAGGMEYLEQLVASAQPATDLKLREYAEAIRETAMRRQLIALARAIAIDARTSKGFASDIAAEHASKLADTAGRGARDASYVHIAVPLSRTMNKAQSPQAESVLSTGIPRVDEKLFGGLRRRQVTILAARTSVGKSALALEIAISAHESSPNDAVLYVSMEMSEDEFTDRMVSSRSRVETKRILRGEVTPEEMDRLIETKRRLYTQEIFFNVRQNLTLSQIRGIATKVSREVTTRGKRLGLIVIDHMGLVKPASRKTNREQEVAEVSRDLRGIANDFDCHVMALAQISREAEKQTGKNKMPQLSHLRESGSIEQDANNVLILHRERRKDGHGFNDENGARLVVAKARNAELGPVWLAVEPKFVRFMPWEGSEQAKARAPRSRPSGNYVNTDPSLDDGMPPDPPPGRFDDEEDQ